MDLIQLKIRKDSNMIKYIKPIRKFDNSLSVTTIKKRIEHDDFVVEFDLEHYDVLEDINDMDKKETFRSLIAELYNLEAKVRIYQNGELISLELLDNWLETLNGIDIETERDIERELGEEE